MLISYNYYVQQIGKYLMDIDVVLEHDFDECGELEKSRLCAQDFLFMAVIWCWSILPTQTWHDILVGIGAICLR